MTLPLDGIRVADFSWVIAGPFCTQFLSLMGAEVIKIESAVHTDITRRLPPYADTVPGLERSGLMHGMSYGKKSVTLDLSKTEAQELALEIVGRSDIAIENFAYGQMEKFNLGYERLRETKPDLIFVTSSGLGRFGPYQSYVTYGPPLTAYTGLASITGQDGGSPERALAGLWSDHQAAISSLFGLLAALEHRDRTGEGQMVEYSMAEATAAQLPEAFAEYGCTGVAPGPRGNRDRAMCPHGIYPARGEDRWVAIAVQSDPEWRRFRNVVPGPRWWHSAELETHPGRAVREREIDAVIAEWTRGHTAEDAARFLQEVGIASGPAASVEDLLEDEILNERGFFIEQDHPEVGRRRLPGIGFRAIDGSRKRGARAPLLGEHNWEILVDELGLAPDKLAELMARGIIE